MNEEKLHGLVGRILQDLGGAFSVPLVQIGERLGLYKALSESGPLTSEDLAGATGLSERYLREWLSAMSASGYIDYDADARKFSMSPEQAFILAQPDSPFYLAPAFGAAAAFHGNLEKVCDAFSSGEGVPWGDQSECLSCAVARFFRPGYHNHLVQEWLPALEGVVAKLEAGADVADIGCGHGLSTVIMAKAFPNSRFVGYDYHPPSIEEATRHAAEHDLENLKFEVHQAKDLPGSFDLVTLFDCLHDLGDPVGAMQSIGRALKPDGTCMIVEPMAGDSLTENLNPVGRLYYSASTMVCVPTSLSQEVGVALGAQAGESRLREVIVDGAGFSTCRRAAETPFNLILEAKP
ncbi:SAM-dependent methyltransferase [Haloferula helveola]|uniref:SAM-dependent methyltransferase n=1 Tax=Haloferula helveola TaxID=490095 RepID=A0ABM7R9H3_9BACT|nr:SAM-dependent methyltransferase [Haloferula helveola]